MKKWYRVLMLVGAVGFIGDIRATDAGALVSQEELDGFYKAVKETVSGSVLLPSKRIERAIARLFPLADEVVSLHEAVVFFLETENDATKKIELLKDLLNFGLSFVEAVLTEVAEEVLPDLADFITRVIPRDSYVRQRLLDSLAASSHEESEFEVEDESDRDDCDEEDPARYYPEY